MKQAHDVINLGRKARQFSCPGCGWRWLILSDDRVEVRLMVVPDVIATMVLQEKDCVAPALGLIDPSNVVVIALAARRA